MPNERTSDLLYDTASSLRLLDAELGELAPLTHARTLPTGARPSASGVTSAASPSIRERREQFRATATERLHQSNEKLGEVSTTTASAALDIMHALERAVARVDELETSDVLADSLRGYAIRNALRDELFTVMSHMQFQDITSQQIMHVQSMLVVMQGRLAEIAGRLETSSPPDSPAQPDDEGGATPETATHSVFDPNATLANAGARQALADAIVGESSRSV
jgi:hypothetical protein